MLRIQKPQSKESVEKRDEDELDELEEEKHEIDDAPTMERRKTVAQEQAQESLASLVTHSPADMDPTEYVTLCANILNFKRNVVMTANIHNLDFHLVVAQNIADAMEQRNGNFDGVSSSPEQAPVVG